MQRRTFTLAKEIGLRVGFAADVGRCHAKGIPAARISWTHPSEHSLFEQPQNRSPVLEISANLLRDEELVDLIAASGGKWIFIGMESVDPANLKDVNKGFNKPGEFAAVLERLAKRNIYAITSFIFGMDNAFTRTSTPPASSVAVVEEPRWFSCIDFLESR
jgi:hypothetical protein